MGKAYRPYFRTIIIIIDMKKIIKRIGKDFLSIVVLWITGLAANGHINTLTIITSIGVISYLAYKVGT